MSPTSALRNPRALAGAALAAVAALALVACSDSSAETTSASGSSEANVVTSLDVGLASTPLSLDPNVASSVYDGQMMRQIFDSLVWENEDHEFEPWLADSWDISDDGMTYTFFLKEGVTFHDGTAFDAAAVKANIDRILDADTGSLYAKTLLGTVTGSTVIDDHTVTLDLSSPYSPLLEALSQPFLGMASPTAVEEYGDEIAFHPVGTGPFMYSDYTADVSLELVANPDYDWAPEGVWEGATTVETLTYHFTTVASNRIGSLQSGELDVAQTVPTEQLESLDADDSIDVTLLNAPGATYSLYLNERQEPWDTVEGREAFRAAIDVDAILDTLYFGYYERAWSILSPATSGYDADLEGSWDYDPDLAISTFEDLGYERNGDGYFEKDGEVLTVRYLFTTPNSDKRHDIAEILATQLAEVGVMLDNQPMEFAQYSELSQQNEYELESYSITTGSPSVLGTIFNPANVPVEGYFGYNVANYVDDELYGWIEDALATSDSAEQDALYSQVQQRANEQAVAVPLYVLTNSWASTSDITGIVYDPRGYALFAPVTGA